ncbi:MAG: PHB depolymerase family esterase [Bacteroidia bacterium]
MHRYLRFSFFLAVLLLGDRSFSQDLQRIRHFGKNKGHLKMYIHEPAAIDSTKPAPMIVMLHGCTQCAERADKQSGWSKLADQHGFYVLYPQQRFWNNPEKCFRWYKRKHTIKNHGENYSILQMVDYMKGHYRIDSSRIFITGLSAGAAMAVVMMADYPQVFNSGAIFAGGAYKPGRGTINAALTMLGWQVKSAEKWGRIVRKQNPGYTGQYPRMIIYQGQADWVVNRRNAIELMKQWTNLRGVSYSPTNSIDGYLQVQPIHRFSYGENEDVIFYKIDHMNHALPVDPGTCKNQGGRRGIFSRDLNYNSTLWTIYDFGLATPPMIEGETKVTSNQTVTFSVPSHAGSTYQWHYPEGCTRLTDNTSNAITLTWGARNGWIDVTETDANNCKTQYKTLFVTLNDPK